MILTVTMNPSVDMSYRLDHLELDGVNRVAEVIKTAGGKGLNVARILKEMGDDVLATGVAGGHFGSFIEGQLFEQDVPFEFVHVHGETRSSVAILHDGRNQTEILESGPEVAPSEAERFIDTFQRLDELADCVTISGSLPRGLDDDFYARLIRIANNQGSPVLLDASGSVLQAVLDSSEHPYLIKPNLAELSGLLGRELTRDDLGAVVSSLADERFEGIDWIVVSLGSMGAIARHGNSFYRVTVPDIEVVSPVGSGDATVGGFAHAIVAGSSDEDVLRCGMTTGNLNAMQLATGHIDMSQFDNVFSQVGVERI